MTIVKRVLSCALALYAAGVALLYAGQRHVMSPGSSVHAAPGVAGLPRAEEVVLQTDDEERLIAWHVPPVGEKPAEDHGAVAAVLAFLDEPPP